MSGRLARLFDRYAARHLAVERPGPVLMDSVGRPVGRVERVALRHDRLVVEGHASADLVGLEHAGRRRTMAPEPGLRTGAEPMPDGMPAAGGFRLDLPFEPGPAHLTLAIDGWIGGVDLPPLSGWRLGLARAAIAPAFARDAGRALTPAWRWWRYHDMGARQRIKDVMGLGPLAEAVRLDPAMLPVDAPAVGHATGAVTIVLPVHDAFDLLPEALGRVAAHTDLPWRLILVEDASRDARVRPFLRDWVGGAEGWPLCLGVTLIENEVNLGFIGSVNLGLARALEATPGDPVVLLNSDAFVPEGWASRLVAPLADPTVASITPMSNDAELMSVPVLCTATALWPGEGDAIDACARLVAAPEGGWPEAPTGVGFCMAMAPAFLARLPGFDPAFGRGYGEEVDWCQAVLRMGGRHLCHAGLFAEHRGGASFGTPEKRALLIRNGAIVSARHPRFDADVQRWIGDDPLATARLALGLAWAAARAGKEAVPVYLGHSMGGGADHYLERRLKSDVARQGAAVVVRVGGPSRWGVELHAEAGVTRGGTSDRALLLRLLALVPCRRVVFSCGVGDPDPVELPGLMLEIADGQGIEVLFHDYLPISPSYTLLGREGMWRGLPRPGSEARGHVSVRPDGTVVDLAAWQAAWRQLLIAAGRIVTFSEASRALVAEAYPEAVARLEVAPHDDAAILPLLPMPGGGQVIGVLGNIGQHKGAGVLTDLSRLLARRTSGVRLVVIGNVDPGFALARGTRVHGDYRVDEIPALAARYGVTCWLVPSIWPETFSYTTHEALSTGLPVLAFDLGAQGEAVGRAVALGQAGAVVPLPEGRRGAAEAVLAAVGRLGG